MSKYREEYMAGQIKDIANYRKNVLLLIEYERVNGVMESVE